MSLLEKPNRGLLLDVVVLGGNLLGVMLLEGFFLGVVRRAAADDPAAMRLLFAGAVALFVLAPVGATLKRWHYHRRLGGGEAGHDSPHVNGCLFNPIFYFCLVAVIFAFVASFLLQGMSGRGDPGEAVVVASAFGGVGLILLHTFLVYRYFSAPRKPPVSAFMRGPWSEVIGDACLFANMLLFQLVWNLLSFADLGRPSGALDVAGRLAVLCFLALLLYFPPRMFYLAEDAGKARTWLMILLANAPVMARVLLGAPVAGP